MTSFTTDPKREKLREDFLEKFGTALNNLNDPNDKGVLNTQSTAKVFDWFLSQLDTQIGEEKKRLKLRLDVAIEAWMETYEKKQKTFKTQDFIKFLEEELK